MADPFYPGLNVPPGQESGFWSQLYMQATGTSYLAMANPATSVLPLIKQPGLGNQLVPNNSAVTHVALPFLPLSQAIAGHGCDAFNKAAYAPSTFAATRLNATSQPKDVAVPGLTLHEAATLYQPPSPTCTPIAGAPATILGLQQLLSESETFYPVLGTFASVQPTTELNAALSLHPSLTTVWLGANDVLHYAFSGGAFTGADDASQAQADLTHIITSLQQAGSAVVVANIPNVLQTPFYFSVATPPALAACQLQNFLVCDVESLGVPPSNAAAIVSGIAAQYNLGTTGYLTLQGFLAELQASPQFSADLNALAGGNGLGSMYVTPAFAANIQNENDAINSGIAAAATATGVPLVDVKAFTSDIATGNTGDPYAAQALSVNPGKCCSLAFLGGLQRLRRTSSLEHGLRAHRKRLHRCRQCEIQDEHPRRQHRQRLQRHGGNPVPGSVRAALARQPHGTHPPLHSRRIRMLAHMLLLAALQTTPSPAATTAPAPSAAATREDPAITKIVRAQYDAFAAGKVDASQYSISVPQNAIAQVQAGLASAGAVKSVTFLKMAALPQGTVYAYKFTCANGAVIEQISLKDGKINGIYFRPVA